MIYALNNITGSIDKGDTLGKSSKEKISYCLNFVQMVTKANKSSPFFLYFSQPHPPHFPFVEKLLDQRNDISLTGRLCYPPSEHKQKNMPHQVWIWIINPPPLPFRQYQNRNRLSSGMASLMLPALGKPPLLLLLPHAEDSLAYLTLKHFTS